MKGGYVEVDATGLDLANLGKVDGIYNKLMAAYNTDKLVVLSGVKNGNSAFTPIACFLSLETNYIALAIMNIPYRVASTDVVTQE